MLEEEMNASRLFLTAVVALTLGVQASLCCVTPLDLPDPWSSDVGDGAGAPRLRREVTLSERKLCAEGDPPPPDRVDTKQRVNDLIAQMGTRGLDAYIVPNGDEHQSEYTAAADRRRQFVSGFTGSAGTALLLATGQRALWTDGRYFLQADDELDCDWLLMKEKQDGVPTMTEWLGEQLAPGSRVGVDPSLVGASTFMELQEKLNDSRIVLEAESTNLVDLVWPDEDRPPRLEDPLYVLGDEFAGKKWTDKVHAVREAMKKEKVDLLVITALDEIAWLLNLRSNDIPYNPVFRSYVMMDFSKLIIFIENDRITPIVDFHLHVSMCMEDICTQVTGYENLVPRLQAAAAGPDVNKVLLPKKYAYAGGVSYAVLNAVPKSKRHLAVSPVLELKARKNEVEVKGMKNAHVKDAVALVDFLAFLEKEIEAGKDWDELSASRRLEQFRAEQEHFVSLSFETISAFGSNGAIIHYRPNNATNKKITRDSLYLLDSGAQYKDGTTDVTRTLHYGSPTPLQRETYTRVLMGAIDLASLVFPYGTGDASVDILARRYLFQVGLDYNHGTGHGIGMFLNIHESPTQLRINNKENHKFELGQFFSDEPGYYKSGEFGVRLETILAVVPATTKYRSEKPHYAFEAVTLVPFEPKLIDMTLLNAEQCEYLNDYHSRVRSVVGRELEKQNRLQGLSYLRQRTEPLQCSTGGLSSGSQAAPASSATMRPRGAASSSTSGAPSRLIVNNESGLALLVLSLAAVMLPMWR